MDRTPRPSPLVAYVLRRLGSAAVLLFLALTATFFLVHLAPGEPGRLLLVPMSEETADNLRRLYGLDRSLGEQYVRWMAAVARGEWGVSFSSHRPVAPMLAERLKNTSLLVMVGVALEHVLALALALLVARRPDRGLDRATRWLSVTLYSVPIFVLGIVLIDLFTVRWPILPGQHMTSAGFERMGLLDQFVDLGRHLVLPALTLALVRCGPTLRYVRNQLIEVLQQDYVRTARAKGLSEWRVLVVHALPNALGPVIQRLGYSLPLLLSGTLVLEVVFAWPGLGTAVYAAVFQRDYPVILAATALTAFMVVLGSFVADVVHAWVDPRMRRFLVTG